MTPLVDLVRWYNRASPFNQWKPSLGKWAGKRLDLTRGPAVYDGVQGRFRMRLDLADGFERSVYLNVNNCLLVQVLRRILKPGDVFVDAGANLGLLTLIASECVGPHGRVHAFEPYPRALERLRENLELNRVTNTVVIPKGCWSEAGAASLFDFTDGGIDLPSMGRRPDRAVAGEVVIETVRIDDAVEPPATAIKVDVEGAEWGALRGAERLLFGGAPPHLLLELNQRTSAPFGYHPLELVDWILERAPGYRLHLLKSKHRVRVDRERLARLIAGSPTKNRNLWFEPCEPATQAVK
jgi:FkbM family methyltransferase